MTLARPTEGALVYTTRGGAPIASQTIGNSDNCTATALLSVTSSTTSTIIPGRGAILKSPDHRHDQCCSGRDVLVTWSTPNEAR